MWRRPQLPASARAGAVSVADLQLLRRAPVPSLGARPQAPQHAAAQAAVAAACPRLSGWSAVGSAAHDARSIPSRARWLRPR